MRFALVSDIHGNLPALEAVAADIGRRGITQVINLGDSLSGPLLARDTARWLMASDWLHLAGNHERQILACRRTGRGGASDAHACAQLGEAEFDWLQSLRPSHRWSEAVLLCHGSPRSDCEYLLETVDGPVPRLATAAELGERLAGAAASLVACGHTHVPRQVLLGDQLLVNPGSVGLQAYEDDHPQAHRVETGSPHARYAVVERLPAGAWAADLLSLPYDYGPMAELARANGRPDWERALRTGRC